MKHSTERMLTTHTGSLAKFESMAEGARLALRELWG